MTRISSGHSAAGRAVQPAGVLALFALALLGAYACSSNSTTDTSGAGAGNGAGGGTTTLATGSGGMTATGTATSTGAAGNECPGAILCGGVCTNVQNDPKNCGACSTAQKPTACADGFPCFQGQCVATCEGAGGKTCNGSCVDVQIDPQNCGACGKTCMPGQVCAMGQCGLECSGGTTECGMGCVDLKSDPSNCGKCGNKCNVMGGEVCTEGLCAFSCIGGTTNCNSACVDTSVDPKNCGKCGNACKPNFVCSMGMCASVCGGNLLKCGNSCLDVSKDHDNCGACGNACKNNENCTNGQCVVCDPNVTDCDGDGWMVKDGDCCDIPGPCGAKPWLVNPGAIEIVGNGIDDNCDGLQDFFDVLDTTSCDAKLAHDSQTPGDYAKAIGICRTTTLQAPLPQKTWGLIEAKLLRADGSPLGDFNAVSIRNFIGNLTPPNTEGQQAAYLSNGIASDDNQTNPGPNMGPNDMNLPFPSNVHANDNGVDIGACNDPAGNCIKDWFTTANPPLKQASQLPVAPNCGKGDQGPPNMANDSVMLELKLRAPTNVLGFSLNTYFMSAEFPQYVCSNYNDQFLVLIDTPKPTQPLPNPVDKNLMVYNDGMNLYPIGINLASATSLFNVCDSSCATDPMKGDQWHTGNASVSKKSCSLGADQLTDTGFGVNPTSNNCPDGGGTFWLTTNGNVIPGDLVTLRIVVWDVGDHLFDSNALIDGFKWSLNGTVPGTADK